VKDIYEFLDENQVGYERHDHRAVFTVEEAKEYSPKLDGASTKNLFLRDKKGTRHFLLTVPEDKKVDLKYLSTKIGSSVEAFIDQEIWQAEAILCHPLVNTSTLVIPRKDMGQFLEKTGHGVNLIEV